MYSIKQEPTGDSETCLTSCTSEYEMVSVKEEKTSVVAADPVEKTEHEVNSNESLCALFKSFCRILLGCIISTESALRALLPHKKSTASAVCFLLPQKKQNFGSPSCLGGFHAQLSELCTSFFGTDQHLEKLKQRKVVSSEIRQFPTGILINCNKKATAAVCLRCWCLKPALNI